jgi:outer membrane immunogenic protein
MKNHVFGSVAALVIGLGGSALAADMPLKAPPPVVVYNWTGCYLGLDIGTNYGRNEGYATTAASTQGTGGGPVPGGLVGPVTDRINLSGFIGGAFGGCNYQFAGTGWVFGVEGDWSVLNKEGQAFANAAAVAAGFNPQRTWWTQEHWLGTARARLGYAVTDKWLWYVTGGGAWAKIDSSQAALNNVTAFHATNTDWRGGWTVGAGTEYMVGYGWSIRSEFLYVQFPSYSTFGFTPPGSAMITNMTTGKIQDYIFRFGMSYKFGWVGKSPVVAKY